MEGHKKVVEILLHYGADTEVKDKEGWKAIDHSAMTGNHKLVSTPIIYKIPIMGTVLYDYLD